MHGDSCGSGNCAGAGASDDGTSGGDTIAGAGQSIYISGAGCGDSGDQGLRQRGGPGLYGDGQEREVHHGSAVEDFGLLDDGRTPEQVFRFQQQTNLPLRVGIMLDTSSSIRQRFQFEQDSAIDVPAAGAAPQRPRVCGGLRRRDRPGAGIYQQRRPAGPGNPQAASGRRDGTVRCALLDVQGPDADVARYGAGAQDDRPGVGRRRQLQPRTGVRRDQGVPASGHDRVRDQHRREPEQGQGRRRACARLPRQPADGRSFR